MNSPDYNPTSSPTPAPVTPEYIKPIMEPPINTRKRGRTPDLSIIATKETHPVFLVETAFGDFRETWLDPSSLENAPRKTRRLNNGARAARNDETSVDPMNAMSVLEKIQSGISNGIPKQLLPPENSRPIKRAVSRKQVRFEPSTPPPSSRPQASASDETTMSPKKKTITTVLGLQKSVNQHYGLDYYTGLAQDERDQIEMGIEQPTVMPEVAEGRRHETTQEEQNEHLDGAMPFV